MRTGLFGTILTALLFPIVPTAALALQYQKLNTGTSLRLNIDILAVNNDGIVPVYAMTTPLNRISTSNLTGENSFILNDLVFVFMSPGPKDIWYPYAISKRRPDQMCESEFCLVLNGRVTQIARDSLGIEYGFERLIKTKRLAGLDMNNRQTEVHIQVDKSGNTVLKTMRIGNIEIDQRNLFKWNPPGSTNFGAKIAPATNPPK